MNWVARAASYEGLMNDWSCTRFKGKLHPLPCFIINVPLWLSFYQGPKEFFITDDVHPPTKMKVPALNDVITQGQLYFQATGFREPHTPWRGKIIPTKMREMWVAFD